MTLDLTQSRPSHVRATSGRPVEDSTLMEVWQGLSDAIVDQIADNWAATTERYAKGRQEHYFSAEFLMGRALLNNLSNLGLVEKAREALAAYGLDLGQVLEEEPDAALGNGGLGRLAACFLDSCATLDLPVRGYGILYRYGLFKQLFDNGFQTEHPDPWMEEGYPFVTRREERSRIVSYADLTVRAVPYDIAITGYGTKNVGTLRLWKAEPLEEFDYDAFNSQRFTEAIESLDFRAYDALRAMGVSLLPRIRYAVLPQLGPAFSSAVLYRFDVNIREASVLGLVGAGGIGAPLIFAMNQYAWNDVSAIFLGFVLLVWLIDAGSARLRTRRAAAAPGNKT